MGGGMKVYENREIDAVRWWGPGDHSAVFLMDEPGQCHECSMAWTEHGRTADMQPVCPGDYIVSFRDSGFDLVFHPDDFHIHFHPVETASKS